MLGRLLLWIAFVVFALVAGAQGVVLLENPAEPVLSLVQAIALFSPLDFTGEALPAPVAALLKLPALLVSGLLYAGCWLYQQRRTR